MLSDRNLQPRRPPGPGPALILAGRSLLRRWPRLSPEEQIWAVECFTEAVIITALETTTEEKQRINEMLRELLERVGRMNSEWVQRN